MTSQCLCRTQLTRQGFMIESTPEEDRIVAEHFESLKHLTEEGTAPLAGRTTRIAPSSPGIAIFGGGSRGSCMRGRPRRPGGQGIRFRAELFRYRVALAGRKALSG